MSILRHFPRLNRVILKLVVTLRKVALDRRNYRQVVETTVELANKAGVTEIVSRIVNDLKDESEPYRRW